MGFISSLFGGQASYQAQGVTPDQLQQSLQQAQAGIGQQQQFTNALQGLGGAGIQAQQAGLAGLQGVANGTGPNPAMAMLNQQTGQNVAQQAALMASQRGVGSNAGLLARQAAQQGANIQQNAIGQGASLQAQQQLNALGQLGQQGAAATGQQQAGLGQLLGAQQNLSGQYGQNLQNQQGINAQIASGNADRAQAATMGVLGLAHGGSIPNMSDGGSVPNLGISPDFSNIGKAPDSLGQATDQPTSTLGKALSGLKMAGAFMSDGGHVPGKPRVFGDSEANDTVPAMLSPGEIVVPRTKAKDPKAAAKFAAAVALRSKKRK